MKKKLFLGCISCIALLLSTACSNDENNSIDGSKINTAKSIEFEVNFSDYNKDQEANITRSAKGKAKLEQQTIGLGNGIVAQCTLLRDTAKNKLTVSTRALDNATYTMLAYETSTHAFKGELKGTVVGGVFTPTSANPSIILAPGTYDFVLYNDNGYIVRNGNNLTVYRPTANSAYIARTTQTITATPIKQKVVFQMKHADAKVTIRLEAYDNFPAINATLSSVNSTDISSSSVYDASTGTWAAGTSSSISEPLQFAHGTDTYTGGMYENSSSNSTSEIRFLPGTDVSKLKITFNSGSIYNQSMANVSFTFNPSSTLKLEENGSYVLVVKLAYNFLYLMSDGSIGNFQKTTYGGGTKTPIAVVLSQSKRMAIALKDAAYSNKWCADTYAGMATNTHVAASQSTAISTDATSGRDETWEASYSTGSIGVKANNPDFPPFYVAAHYDPGVTYTGTPALQWYLPSMNDWTYVPVVLGLSNRSQITSTSIPWKFNMQQVAFRQVSGTPIAGPGSHYYSSTEIAGSGPQVGGLYPYNYGLNPFTVIYNSYMGFMTRPFVAY